MTEKDYLKEKKPKHLFGAYGFRVIESMTIVVGEHGSRLAGMALEQ